MARFADALNRSAETIKRPPPLPAGTYIFRVTKLPDPPVEIDTKVGKMERLSIPLAVVREVEVDEDELAAFGNVQNQPMRRDFLFSNVDDVAYERTLDQFKRFCTHCGINTEQGTPGEWRMELPNAQLMGEVGLRKDDRDESGETFYAEIKRTAPVE